MEYFFRNQIDENFIGLTRYQHIALVALFFAFVFLFIYLGKKDKVWGITKLLAIVLLVEQVVEYSWFVLAPYLEWPLPFYHCRIVKIVLIISILFYRKNFRLKYYAIACSFYGGLSSFLFPNPDHFNFPHFLNFSYYGGHLIIVLLSIGLIFKDKIILDRKKIRDIFVTTEVINSLIFTYDIITNKNYSFLLEAPQNIKGWPFSGPIDYPISVFVVYGLLSLIGCVIWYVLQGKFMVEEGVQEQNIQELE